MADGLITEDVAGAVTETVTPSYYFIKGSKEEIETINRQIATELGCQPPTIYWYSMAELKDGNWGMFIDDARQIEGMLPIAYEDMPQYLA
jgi:hypothetical protein